MGEATRDYGKSCCVLLTVQNAVAFIQVFVRVPSIPRERRTVPRYPSSPSALFVFSGSRSRPSAHMDASGKSFLIERSGPSATQILHSPHQAPYSAHRCLGGLRCRQSYAKSPIICYTFAPRAESGRHVGRRAELRLALSAATAVVSPTFRNVLSRRR